MLKRIEITKRIGSDINIQLPLIYKTESFGLENTIDTFVSNQIDNQLLSNNLKEKIVYKCDDNRLLKFFFFKQNSMNSVFDNTNLSKADRDSFYKSQFIIELFDSNVPSIQKRIDVYYVTLYRTVTMNKSEFNLNNFLELLQIPEENTNGSLYLKFLFFNAKDNKKYLFKLGNTEEINNNNQFIEIILNNSNKTYKMATSTLDFYQAIIFNKKGILEENEDNELIPQEPNQEDVELTPQNDGVILDETGLLLKETVNSFSCYANLNIVGDDTGTVENPINVFEDFFNPRFPMITIKFLDFAKESTVRSGNVFSNSVVAQIPFIAAGIAIVGRTYSLSNNISFQVQVTYWNTYTIFGNTYPRTFNDLPPIIPQAINFSFSSSVQYADIDERLTYIINNISNNINVINPDDQTFFPYSGTLQPNNTPVNYMFPFIRFNPSDRARRAEGFLDFEFVADSNDVNIMYLDRNNSIITTNFNNITNPSKMSEIDEFAINTQNQLVNGITYEPTDFVRIKLIP